MTGIEIATEIAEEAPKLTDTFLVAVVLPEATTTANGIVTGRDVGKEAGLEIVSVSAIEIAVGTGTEIEVATATGETVRESGTESANETESATATARGGGKTVETAIVEVARLLKL
ncbi:hypothetical protein AC579_9922 [Pseudocercospora musae]|uniref:Uncharacterized protein n=1 Tax=Pseudocercospora musae TaxID=113226 RepID=A0A139IFD7_9PEZI|nr:hypothetical protein AC579_9922 [Pseudocercospora musae]